MPSFNRVIIAGHLTRDPELRHIPSGTAVCEFTLGVNRSWTSKDGEKKEEVSFIDCVAWDRRAEVIAQWMAKGRPLLVEGYLKQERWEDKDGQKRSRVRVQVDGFTFLGSKPDGEGATAAKEEGGDYPF